MRRLGEKYSSDTIFSDTPAMDDGIKGHGGCTVGQLYGGLVSRFMKFYPMRSKADVAKTYADFLRKIGAPLALHTDCAKENDCEDMRNLHRLYGTNHFFSEPYYQHQNPIERMIQDVKRLMDTIMSAFQVPPEAWLLCMDYSVGLLNHLSLESLNGLPPVSVAFGGVADISPYLCFHFWQEVLFEHYDNDTFPTQKKQKLGRFVGIAEDCGDSLTFLVLDSDTLQVVPRSEVRAAHHPTLPPRLDPNAPDGAESCQGSNSHTCQVL